jgi:hypothetical protein
MLTVKDLFTAALFSSLAVTSFAQAAASAPATNPAVQADRAQ